MTSYYNKFSKNFNFIDKSSRDSYNHDLKNNLYDSYNHEFKS